MTGRANPILTVFVICVAIAALFLSAGCFKTPPTILPVDLLVRKTWVLQQIDTTEFGTGGLPARHWATVITDCRRSETLHFLFDQSILKNFVCGQPYDQLLRGKWELQPDSLLSYTYPGANDFPIFNLSHIQSLTWDSLLLSYPESHYDTAHTLVVTGEVLWRYAH